MMTLFTSSVAVAEALDGKVPQALETIENALQMNPGELSWRPEAIRVRGELRLRLGQTEAAEHDFREAIALPKRTEARAWELHATTGLTHLQRDTSRSHEARSMLAEIYYWFTEGFDTADLKDAKALLD